MSLLLSGRRSKFLGGGGGGEGGREREGGRGGGRGGRTREGGEGGEEGGREGGKWDSYFRRSVVWVSAV